MVVSGALPQDTAKYDGDQKRCADVNAGRDIAQRGAAARAVSHAADDTA